MTKKTYQPKEDLSAGSSDSGSDQYVAGAWLAVAILTLVYAVNIADRYVLSTLLEPIKADFQLSDGATGILTGVSLAIVYTLAGLPIAALADRTNRKKLIAISIVAWSSMTVVCGLATNFWHMLLGRVGTGIGEAGATPSSHALLADKFKDKARPLALSIMGLGASIGAWLGASGAGMLNDAYGWRETLIIFGVCGFPVALITLMIKEPKRGQSDVQVKDASTSAGLVDTLRYIVDKKNRALFHVMLGSGVVSFWGWGLVWWVPAFLSRSFGLTTGEAGAMLGPIYGIGGTALMIVTVIAMAVLKNRPTSWPSYFTAIFTLIGTVPSVALFLTHDLQVAKWMMWAFIPAIYVFIGPTAALVQNLLPPQMRAKGAAIYMFMSNIPCLALAPLMIGFSSDIMQPYLAAPQESLRWALLATSFTGVWAAYHYWAAGRLMKPGASSKPDTTIVGSPKVVAAG
ncbi:spinster family MFS transporter [Pseudomonas fluorescens]|uniref:spinster family MFS transporter n=1 Tax=Pseudomonas fluorescens TaxID=294 RepID=UPI0007322240|nr:MFS transporter [Pseudomonas fluorescens]